MTKKLIIFSFLVAILTAVSCTRPTKNTSTSGIATVICDESFENILNQEVEIFEYTYPNANIMAYYIGKKNEKMYNILGDDYINILTNN